MQNGMIMDKKIGDLSKNGWKHCEICQVKFQLSEFKFFQLFSAQNDYSSPKFVEYSFLLMTLQARDHYDTLPQGLIGISVMTVMTRHKLIPNTFNGVHKMSQILWYWCVSLKI